MFRLPGQARLVRQIRQSGGLIHAALRHVAIGRPLAAGDAQQPALINVDGMIPRERRRIAALARFRQRTNSGEDAEDVGSGRFLLQVKTRGFQHEFDFLIEGDGFQRCLFHRRIGRADQRVAMPGNGEHDAPIFGVRHQDGIVARQKRAVQHQMRALARRDELSWRPARRDGARNR